LSINSNLARPGVHFITPHICLISKKTRSSSFSYLSYYSKFAERNLVSFRLFQKRIYHRFMLFCLSQRTQKAVPRNPPTHFRDPPARSLATQRHEISHLWLSTFSENICPSTWMILGCWTIQDQCCIYFQRHALALLPHLHASTWF
jgi:hypothetical protein